MILLLDNYDSFVYNLDRYLRQMNQKTLVVRSDAITVAAIEALGVEGIVISPGPKTPDEAGCSLEVVRRLGSRIPILGVCLGHQTIGQALGGTIIRAPRPMHGQSSWIHREASVILEGLENPFQAGRYHSLIVERNSLPECLACTAWTEDGLVMAIEHRAWNVMGVQFHPESILTPNGHRIIANFLKLCKAELPASLPHSDYAPN
jgi:anthranilate synthase component II